MAETINRVLMLLHALGREYPIRSMLGSFLPQDEGCFLYPFLLPPGKAGSSWQVTAKSHLVLLEVRCVLFVPEVTALCL